MEYELIDPEAMRKAFWMKTALDAEVEAVLAELGAQQLRIAVEEGHAMNRPGMAEQILEQEENAKRLRSKAKEAHKQAGTKPDTFAQDVDAQLRAQLHSMEVAHLHEVERATHAGAFDENQAESEWNAAVMAVGLDLARTKREVLRDIISKADAKTSGD